MYAKEVPAGHSFTFEGIALENRKRMELMGIMPNNKAAEHALMQMMSCVGEMATLAYRNSTSLSPFEHNEIYSVIGKMAVCLSTIGEAFDVAVGQAALDSIAEQTQKSGDTTSDRSRREQPRRPMPIKFQQDTAPHPDSNQSRPQEQQLIHKSQQQQSGVLLSPTSNRDFFSFLDELTTYDRADFEKAELKWVAPSPGGTIRDLIQNGSTTSVTYDDLPKYLDLVRRYRSARVEDGPNERPPGATDEPSAVPYDRSAALPVAPAFSSHTRSGGRGDGDGGMPKDGSLFNPQNQNNSNLFSPSSNIFVNNADLSAATPSTLIPPGDRAAVTRVSSGDTATSGEMVSSESDFYAKVATVKRGTVTGAQIAQLNLTFSVPRNGKLVELIPNGIHVRVTSANVSEFLRLLDDKNAMHSGRVRRLESIKKLEVVGAGPQDLSRDKDKFSPTHFSKDIFAPYEERTSFFIDCDASDEILPVFIKQREQQHKKPESEYVRVVRQGDVGKWRSILEEAQRDLSALKAYGVTFCVPSAVVLDATEEEQASNVHELMKGGAATPVEESQFWLFSKMIEQY